MRIDYNVLWVEDNQANVQSQRQRIFELIRKEGFRLATQFASSVDEATGYLSNDIYGDHIDLILMDFDLGSSTNGDEGLQRVREIFSYKDVIFYSGRATSELAQMVKDRDVEGIFTAHRTDLPDVVLGVFENLIRKVVDIDHSRGIVMGATSDIDQGINDWLDTLFEGSDGDGKKEAISAVLKRMKDKREQFETVAAKIEAIGHIKELSDHHAVYTSDDKLRLLLKVLKILGVHSDFQTKLDEYRENVVPKRNDLAHVRVSTNGFARKLHNRRGDELTSDDMRALRIGLLEFQELLDSLKK